MTNLLFRDAKNVAHYYGGYHFAVYAYQMNTLYALNLLIVLCQLHLKAGKKKINLT